MRITSIKGLIACVVKNSSWRPATVRRAVQALGYSVTGGFESLKDLSTDLASCAEHGADTGYSGFTDYSDTIAFYKKNRLDIAANLEETAKEYGMGIIELVQNFGVFRNTAPPASSEIGKALWDTRASEDLTELYNVFAWYVLEEISNIWHRYLEDNPAYNEKLSA